MNADSAWSPYHPTVRDPWDLKKVAHLHRRAGFGATWGRLQRDLRAGPTASVDRLLRPPPMAASERQIVRAFRAGVLTTDSPQRLKTWWLHQMLHSEDSLREKLTLFWHIHFAVSNRKVESAVMMLKQNELFRKHALGRFAQLLTAIEADPAMLVWLDGGLNRKDKPNENFAREFLELFTLGEGNYTEADVRQAARAFSGWVPKGNNSLEFEPDPSEADHGEKTFLGKTGRWRSADIVRITLEQGAAAEFLCRKLYRFFVSEIEPPSDQLIEPLAKMFRQSGYSISKVVEKILRSRHFYSRVAYRARIKSPVELSVGLPRMLQSPRRSINLLALAAACKTQGQDLFYPPNVKGWPGGKSWLHSVAILARGNWCNDCIWGNADFGLAPFDVVSWGKENNIPQEKTVSSLLALLLQDDAAAAARDTIFSTAKVGDPQSLRKALQLIVNCPEFQLA